LSRINGRRKGAAGEREFCDWLQNHLKLKEKPTRNLEQTRNGGADILGVKPFVFEVKRVEKLALRKWWIQVKKASEHDVTNIPVVAFRQNGKPWSFLISAIYIGLDAGYMRLEEVEFKRWIKNYFVSH
jgi:hypothetical protein